MMSLGVFFDKFRDEYAATDAETAMIQSISTACIQFFAMFTSMLMYYSPQGRPFYWIALGSILLSLGYLVAAMAKSLTVVWVAAGLGWGLGSSFLTVSTVAVFPSYFVAEDAKHKQGALVLMTSGTGIGGLFLPFLFDALLEHMTPQNSLLCMAAISFVGLFPFLFAFWQPPQAPLKRKRFDRQFLVNTTVAKLTFGSMVFYFSYFSFNFYLAPFAQDVLGFTLMEVSTALAVLGVIGTVGRISLGFLADKIKNPILVWTIGMTVKALCATAMVGTSLRPIFWIALIIGGFAHSTGTFLMQVITHMFSADEVPTIYGFVYFCSGFGSLAGPFLTGTLVEDYGYLAGMCILQATLIPGVVTLCCLFDSKHDTLPLKQDTHQYDPLEEEEDNVK